MDKVSYSKMFAVVFSAIIAAFAVILLLYVFSLEAQQEIYEEQLDLINKTVTIDAIQFPKAQYEGTNHKLGTKRASEEGSQPDLMCIKYLEVYSKDPTEKNKRIVSSVCGIYK
ncbi:hypothetical protein MHM93_07920 [Pseudoalteromonas sp. MM17-2]|uniref:hypothetical protein n=1 Tax=Pseudoalteromonas sp. MM17-2 TaxID=2917753 RepID=UPI001EF6EC8E|nr:hypothetical protein [Pseudoalteromonas sp. MM17-2]MCG7544107.1 hypothetical protein [Pseudoalteromonas sp. MM17-2]